MYKRIISLFVVFAILISAFPFWAFASEPSMGNANFWEWATSLDDSHPFFQYGQKVLDWFFRVKKGDDSPCPNGVGGVHQWQFSNIGSQLSGKVYCSWCGKEYADVNMSDVEDEYLHDNNLDNGIAVTPASGDTPAGLIWTPQIDLSNVDMLPTTYDSSNSTIYTSGFEHHSFPHTFYGSSSNASWSTYYSYNSDNSIFTAGITHSNQNHHGFSHTGLKFVVSVPFSGSYSIIPNTLYFTDGTSCSITYASYYFTPHSFSASSGDLFTFYFNQGWDISRHSDIASLFRFPSFSVTPSSPVSTPSIPASITINSHDHHFKWWFG